MSFKVSAIEDDEYDSEPITDDLSDLETEGTESEGTVDGEGMVRWMPFRH